MFGNIWLQSHELFSKTHTCITHKKGMTKKLKQVLALKTTKFFAQDVIFFPKDVKKKYTVHKKYPAKHIFVRGQPTLIADIA